MIERTEFIRPLFLSCNPDSILLFQTKIFHKDTCFLVKQSKGSKDNPKLIQKFNFRLEIRNNNIV